MDGSAFESLSQKRKKIATELAELETKIYNLETEYVAQSEVSVFGTCLKGFEGFLGSKNAQARNKSRTFTVQDRAFSLSSYTSPATREMQQESERYAAEAVYGGRGKGVAAYGGVKGVGNSTVPSKRGF